jgi:hypothetical protein
MGCRNGSIRICVARGAIGGHGVAWPQGRGRGAPACASWARAAGRPAPDPSAGGSRRAGARGRAGSSPWASGRSSLRVIQWLMCSGARARALRLPDPRPAALGAPAARRLRLPARSGAGPAKGVEGVVDAGRGGGAPRRVAVPTAQGRAWPRAGARARDRSSTGVWQSVQGGGAGRAPRSLRRRCRAAAALSPRARGALLAPRDEGRRGSRNPRTPGSARCAPRRAAPHDRHIRPAAAAARPLARDPCSGGVRQARTFEAHAHNARQPGPRARRAGGPSTRCPDRPAPARPAARAPASPGPLALQRPSARCSRTPGSAGPPPRRRPAPGGSNHGRR